MELKTYFAQDRAGNLIPNATVTIYLTGTNTLATGLKTANDAALSNPFIAGDDGKIQFKAADGLYDMQVSSGTHIGTRITIQCLDLTAQKQAAEQAAADAEAARDQTQQIIDDAGEQSTLVALAQPDGQTKIGNPVSISALRDINPGKKVKISTLGALSAFDDGGEEWEFDTSDMSGLVSLYPKLFIAPNSDPTGASGAWKLAWKMIGINAAAYGVGLTDDRQHNTDTLNQLLAYNASKQWIICPERHIKIISLKYAGNPKLCGVAGVNSELSSTRVMGSLENGTAFLAQDADSNDPVLWFYGTSSKRVSGVDIIDIAIVSEDLVNNRDLTINPEWQTRSSRIAIRLDYIASKINIDNVGIFGFKRQHFFNEVWDGTVSNCALSIGSDPDGSVPALWIGSLSTDNSNNLTYEGCRIEHCPFSIELGAVNHVRFIGVKVETKRKFNATHQVIKVNDTAINYGFTGDCMFVTIPSTLYPFLHDQGKYGVYNDVRMTGGGINYNYPGIRWIKREPTGTSSCQFTDIVISMACQADGSKSDDYPIILAENDNFGDAVVRTENAYNILNDDGTYTQVLPSLEGLISFGYGTKLGAIHFATNDNAKTAGAILYARTAGFSLGQFSFSGTAHNLLTGANTSAQYDDKIYVSASAGNLTVEKKETLIIASATAILTGLKGITGQVIDVFSYSNGSTIKSNSRIITLSGSDISMVANKVYRFKFVNSTTVSQI